jgi:hypothetical protein
LRFWLIEIGKVSALPGANRTANLVNCMAESTVIETSTERQTGDNRFQSSNVLLQRRIATGVVASGGVNHDSI